MYIQFIIYTGQMAPISIVHCALALSSVVAHSSPASKFNESLSSLSCLCQFPQHKLFLYWPPIVLYMTLYFPVNLNLILSYLAYIFNLFDDLDGLLYLN